MKSERERGLPVLGCSNVFMFLLSNCSHADAWVHNMAEHQPGYLHMAIVKWQPTHGTMVAAGLAASVTDPT